MSNRSYEEDSTSSGLKKYHYIYGGTGLTAIFVMEGTGNDTMHYVLSDHLGSLTGIVNATTSAVTKYSFNAWGIPRDASDWTKPDSSYLFAGRGYTGHEHLTDFNLINMNGRVYDPIVGRFLSPDPYIQAPSYQNSYNRYAYALNNPLKYTDPSGYLSYLSNPGTLEYASQNSEVYDEPSRFGQAPNMVNQYGSGGMGLTTFDANPYYGTYKDESGLKHQLHYDFVKREFYYVEKLQPIGRRVDDNYTVHIQFAVNRVYVDENSSGKLKLNPFMDNIRDAVTLEEFIEHYRDNSVYDVVSETNTVTRLNSSSDGPALRYVIDPVTGNVIDMKHMLIIGDIGGGLGVELWQLITNPSSAFDRQDFFSNQLGEDFFFHYGQSLRADPSKFTGLLLKFFQYPGLRDWIKY